MVTREVGRDRLVSFWLARRESCKRKKRRRSQQPFQLQIYYNLIHHNLTQLALVLSQRTNTLNEIIHKLYHTTNPHTCNQPTRIHMPLHRQTCKRNIINYTIVKQHTYIHTTWKPYPLIHIHVNYKRK